MDSITYSFGSSDSDAPAAPQILTKLAHMEEEAEDALLSALSSLSRQAAAAAAAAATAAELASAAAAPGPRSLEEHTRDEVMHPGVTCSTTVTVSEEEAGPAAGSGGGGVRVSVHATARLTPPCGALRGAISLPELGALAAQAAAAAAADMAHARAAAAAEQRQPDQCAQRFAEVEALLSRGQIVAAEPNPVVSEFGHESYLIELMDPQTGRRCRAIFKPKLEGDAGG
jgi:hypothetical protein